MKNIYSILILFLFTFIGQEVFAQKNIKLRITSISANTTSGTDCDAGCLGGNNRLDWVFDVDDGSSNVAEECWNLSDDNNSNSISPNFLVWDRDYNCSWPGGNIDFRVQGYDEDCADACIGGEFVSTVSDLICTVTVNAAFPSSNGTHGPYTATCNYNANYDGNSNCQGTITVTYQWEVSGDFVDNGNNDICNAYTLGGAELTTGEAVLNTNVDNRCANRQTSEPHGDVFSTLWYKFTTPNYKLISVDVHLGENGSGADNPAIVAYRSSETVGSCPAFNQLTEVGNDIPGLGTDANSDFTVNCLEANKDYYIQVGYNDRSLDGGSTGRFEMDVVATGNTYQAHDMIANAVTIVPSGTAGSTVSAANSNNYCCGEEAGEVEATTNCSNITTDNTIWYKFQAPAVPRNRVILTTDNGVRSFDTEMQLWWSADGSGNFLQFSEVGCNDDKSLTNYASEIDADCLIPGAWYYVQIDGHNGSSGTVRLDIRTENASSSPPSNDNICSATNLNTTNSNPTLDRNETLTQNSQTTFCATPQSGEPNNPITTVWYQFTTGNGSTLGTNVRVFVDATSGLDAYVGVYKGCAGLCPATDFSKLSEIGEDNNLSCLRLFVTCDAEVNFVPEPNSTYYVQVDRITAGNGGPFNLSVQMNNTAAANDHFCVADAIAAYDFGVVNKGVTTAEKTGSTVGTTIEENCKDEPRVSGNDRSVWYKFTTPSLGSNFTASYKIYIDGSGNGDDINPIFNVYEYTGAGTGTAATPHASCGTSFNFQNLSHVIEQGSFTGLSNDIDGTFCVNPSKTYYIQVTGYDVNEQGIFKIKVEGINTPGNDLICGIASPITTYDIGTAGASGTVAAAVGTVTNIQKTGTTILGSNCLDPNPNFTAGSICPVVVGANNNDNAVWYKLPIATNRKDILIKGVTSGDIMDMQFALYEAPTAPQIAACNGSAMTLVSNASTYYQNMGWNSALGTCAAADEDHIFTCLDPTKEYYLMVDNGADGVFTCGTGDFTLNTYYPKEGGSTQCSAEPISSASMLANWTGTHKIALAANFCGNPSPSPAHPIAPWNYEKPVWFKFVAPASGSVNIEVQSDETNLGDEIRPRFWVFEENVIGNCNTLNYTNLDQKDPDDYLSVGDLNLTNEKLDVRCLTPGRTYYVVVDGNTTVTEVCGAGTKVGFFSITLKDLNAPTRKNDTICGATPGRVAGDPYYFIPTPDWKTVNKEAELNINSVDNYCHVIGNNASEPNPIAFGATDWASTNTERGTWFSFTAPPSGKVEIELNNISTTTDQINAQISVFRIKSGKTCRDVQIDPNINNPSTSTLEFYGSSNDAYVSSGADEDLTVSCLMPDSLYYIYVVGVNQGALGLVPDLATGQFNIAVRSYPQDPPARNDNKCNPIYLGQPANTIGSSTGIINASACVTFNRNMTIPAGAPTLVDNGVTLTKPTNNHGTPYAGESTLGCSPNPGCIDDVIGGGLIPTVSDYDRSLYPFNNFCATSVGDSVPSNWGALFGAVDAQPRKTVWFMFKAPDDLDGNGDEAVEIELNQELFSTNPNRDAIDLRGAVFESSNNTCNGNFYDLKSEYDAGDFDETFKVTCLEPGRFYWLMVDGAPSNDEGYFGINISRVAPDPRPANDYICDAYTLSNSFFTGAAVERKKDTNICARITRTATDLTSENDPTGFDLDHTVWYKFTAPTTGVPATGAFAVQVDVNGWGPISISSPFGYSDKMDPQIAIYESQDGTCNWGTNGTNMVEIASEYDILPFTESMKAYCIQPGKTYYIMVDGSPLNSQGFFDITINDIPSITIPTNDDLADASVLTFPSNIGAGNTTTSPLSHNYCTDIQSGELDSWSLYDIDNTVWWKFQVPNSGAYVNQHVDVQIRLRSDPGNTKNDNINLLGAVYHQVAGTAGSPGNTFSNINEEIGTGTNIAIFSEDINLTCLKPGDWYFLQIDGYSGPFNIFRAQGQGWYDVQLEVTKLTPNQGNDSVCGAIQIAVNNTLHPTSGTYNNICKTTQVNENLPWLNADNKTVWFKFIPPASGNITIDLQSQAGDNIGAQLAVYQSLISTSSTDCPAINQLVLSGKEYDALAPGETMTIKCLDNQYWHYLQVNSENIGIWNQGTFKIKIQDIGGVTVYPYNDNICNAKDFGNITNANGTGAFAIVGDSNKCASVQVNEPNTVSNPTSSIQRSVWYKFTAPTSGRARITLHDQDGYLSGIDPEMKLYEGTVTGCPSASPTFSNFVELESAYNPLPNFPSSTTGDEVIEYECFTPGQVYYIQVDGTTVGGPQGFFDIKIEDMLPNYAASPKKPANDEPANAVTLSVNQEQCAVPLAATLSGIAVSGDRLQGSGTWTTGNYKKPTITKKDLIGTCNTTDNCGDIWYKFTMPNDACMLGSVVAVQGYSNQAAVGAQYHNDLKVIAYRGAPGSLTPIDCANADDNALTLDYFHFEVAGTPGETIYLQVFDQNYNDTDNDDEEDFFICVGKRYGVDKCQKLNDVPLMQYQKDYCWNTEGASGEAISSAYGEANNNSDITENSAYFKFKFTDNPCDSLRISIWQPSSSPFLNTTTGCDVANKITLSVYREDDALCDGTINSALISKSYTPACPSGGAAINDVISFTIGAGVLDTNKVYVIQIDGEGQNVNGYVNNGFIRIDTLQRCVNVVAVTYNDTSTGYWKCADGWRYYHDRNKTIIFALHPNGNNFEGVAKIHYKSDYDSAVACASKMAEYSMRRIWDFNITSGTIDPMKPVKVKFYYREEEKQAIIDAANAFKTNCGGFYEPFEWFKTAAGIQYLATNPTQINPARITAGYSVTGCLGSPLFGSPIGCKVITAQDNQYSCNGTLYVELGNIVDFSGGTGAAGVGPWNNASPLPVELLSFTGYNDGAVNVLNWTTASERNSLKFEVEKSYDASNFAYIGEKLAAGNSSINVDYNFIDENPQIGNNYYRLKMIDQDGTFKYSEIINIRVNGDNTPVKDGIVKIFPNPTNGLLNIQYQASKATTLDLNVYDVTGRNMMNESRNVQRGMNMMEIDALQFAKGMYILNLLDKEQQENHQAKFIKE